MVALAFQLGAAALVVCAVAEWLHSRRLRRLGQLAFGPGQRPRRWVLAVPVVRSLAAGALTWGLVILAQLEPKPPEVDLSKEPSQHLLVALDVSPSMYLEDAGTDRNQPRSQRAADLLQAIMDRLDMSETRVTVVAFYTTAMPVVVEAFDLNVVTNVLNGLPLEHAFEVGETRLQSGVERALAFAKPWPPGSATLVVVSDGDTLPEDVLPKKPISIVDTLVLGVGDPYRGSPVAGRTSRQDEASLKRLAVRLGGIYHNGNSKHLPSDVVNALSMTVPTFRDRTQLRDLALGAVAGGGFGIALLPLALALFGAPAVGARLRRRSRRRITAEEILSGPARRESRGSS